MKLVVITGAGSGLGEQLAYNFSNLGYKICLLGRTQSKLEKVAKNIKTNVDLYTVDMTKSPEVQQVFEKIYNEHLTIDCLVNNAGVGIFKNLEDMEDDEIDLLINTNLKSAIYATKAVLPDMQRKNTGNILNIISNSGKYAKGHEIVYSASKFGLRGFSEALENLLQSTNIKILTAYMGNMQTELWRNNTPENIHTYITPKYVAEQIVNGFKNKKKEDNSEINITD